MSWAAHPDAASSNPALDLVLELLSPVLTPLGFAPGQAAASDGRGQVIFCRGRVEGHEDGCVDLVLDLRQLPEWHVVDVRYWGFPSDRWNLGFDRDAALREQVSDLVRTLPAQLT